MNVNSQGGVAGTIAVFIVPAMISAIIIFGLKSRINVYDSFVTGAKDGISTVISIMPNLIALMAAVSVFKASGILDGLIDITSGVVSKLGILPETLPIALIRPLSGSGSLAFLSDVFATYGTDSLIGLTASVMAGTTETVFYTVAVYLGSVGIRRSRFLIPLAVGVDCVCYIIQTAVCRSMLQL